MSSLQVTDQESAAVAKAPRVSLADIELAIEKRIDTTARNATDEVLDKEIDGALARVSICILVMRNGFVVIGKSAPASPANFSTELGRKFAYEDAMRQLWPLMGYALRDKLANQTR